MSSPVLLHDQKGIKLEDLHEIKKEDKSAEFSINKVFLENEFELQLQNMRDIDFSKTIKIQKQYFMQNEEFWPELFIRRSIVLQIKSSTGHKNLKINANKLNCIYHPPEAKSQLEPRLHSNKELFTFIELGSNFVSVPAEEQMILSQGQIKRGQHSSQQQEASNNPCLGSQQNGVTRGQQKFLKIHYS